MMIQLSMENSMKKILAILALSLFAATAQTAHADFFGSNNGEWKMGPNGPYYDESDWPEWTPMYWMEEFMDSFDDDDDQYYGGGYASSMMNNRMPHMPQGGYGYPPAAPYGYPAPAAPVVPAVPVIPEVK